MDEQLVILKNKLLSGTTAELDEKDFERVNRMKFAITVLLDYPHKHRHELVKVIQEEYQDAELSSSYCYKLLSDSEELFPSIEKVNKVFELARLIKIGYKLLHYADEKKNIRDGASVMKVLKELVDMAADSESATGGITIINILKSAPETLNIELPPNFNLQTFIKTLEKEYDPRYTEDTDAEVV